MHEIDSLKCKCRNIYHSYGSDSSTDIDKNWSLRLRYNLWLCIYISSIVKYLFVCLGNVFVPSLKSVLNIAHYYCVWNINVVHYYCVWNINIVHYYCVWNINIAHYYCVWNINIVHYYCVWNITVLRYY